MVKTEEARGSDSGHLKGQEEADSEFRESQ